MEATGRYHEPVAAALHECGIYVCVLNPLYIKQSGGGSIRKVETDKADTMKIAKYGLANWVDLREYTPMDTVRQQLKLCSRQYNLAEADRVISLKECTFLAEKGYDVKSIYNTVKTVYDGEAFIPPSIRVVRKIRRHFLLVIQSAKPDLPCTRMERRPTTGVPARNIAVRSANPKQARVPAATRIGIMGRKTVAARNIRPFPMTTGFPLTAAASISNGLTP